MFLSQMADTSWDYGPERGPGKWSEKYPAAAGKCQSPIDIKTADVHYDSSLNINKLSINYSTANDYEVVNNGHTVTISRKEGTGTQLSGGPLDNEYRFAQFHFHWGKDSSVGSEHLVDGKAFPAELHLVHWNVDRFQSFGEAAGSRNGLAVLGFFVQVACKHANPGFKTITDFLPQVLNVGEKKDLNTSFNLASIIAGNTKDFWTYSGSLTTPPCSESVTWFVFKEPIYATEKQMQKFRSLKADAKHHIMDNYRPVMPLNGRVVRASFE